MLPSPPRLIDFTGYHVLWRILLCIATANRNAYLSSQKLKPLLWLVKLNTSWNTISCEVNQTGRGREHSDDNVPSDKSGYVGSCVSPGPGSRRAKPKPWTSYSARGTGACPMHGKFRNSRIFEMVFPASWGRHEKYRLPVGQTSLFFK